MIRARDAVTERPAETGVAHRPAFADAVPLAAGEPATRHTGKTVLVRFGTPCTDHPPMTAERNR